MAQNRYIFVIIDDHSRYMWTILLREKGEAFEKFKSFRLMIEKELGKLVMTLRTDRGGEFTSREFQDFCEKNGIKRHLTAPYTPQQNGVVERRNRTLMEMTRSMLKAMKVPNYLWGEAVRHSTYLINRVPTRALESLTPYESLRGKKPSLSHLRVFGCLSYAKVEAVNLKKLDDRSQPLVHLGIEPGSKAYRLYNPTTRKIVVSREVVFDEKSSWSWNKVGNETRSEPGMFHMRWGEVIDAGVGPITIRQSETEDNESENQNFGEQERGLIDPTGSFLLDRSIPNSRSIDPELPDRSISNSRSFDPELPDRSILNDDRSTQPPANTTLQDETSPQPHDKRLLRRSDREVRKPRHLEDYALLADEECERLLLTINDEPSCFRDAKDSKKWTQACKEEIESINKNKTWFLMEKPCGVKVIGLKWVFKLKRNADGTINKHKARLVAKGYA